MTSRLRVFAGPNGSGKSTIEGLVASKYNLGYFINPDEIEKEVKQSGEFNFTKFDIVVTGTELLKFFNDSQWLIDSLQSSADIQLISVVDSIANFSRVSFNSYYASVLSDFIRNKLMANGINFTFETVMSAPEKIKFFKSAKEHNYRNYLYFVATKDPVININRVKLRVAGGGHNVPEQKIIDRYSKTLNNLSEVIKYFDRAYFFDNSGDECIEIAQYHDGELNLSINEDDVPEWLYDNLINKL